MVRIYLIVAAALGCFSLISFISLAGRAQSPPPHSEKKTEIKAKEPAKTKTDETSKETPKTKITLDKLKVPGDKVMVLVDDFFIPYRVWMLPEEYQEYQELRARIKLLERQLKSEKKLPQASTCILYDGKQEGDSLTLKARFGFKTEEPKTTVFLGMLGAVVADVGKLDQQPAFPEPTKDGLIIRVEQEGNHQLDLSLRIPLEIKSSAGATEYSLKLGLPGAAVRTLQLKLPGVKELYLDGELQKSKTFGDWHLYLDRTDKLNLTWKHPMPLTGDSLPKVDGQIKVNIDMTQVLIDAELSLEDPRKQTGEWRLLLPPGAVIKDEKFPAGIKCKKIPPDSQKPYHTLLLSEATTARCQVNVVLQLPRPQPGDARIAIGPFVVLGAYEQQGTITVHMPQNVSLGQQLIYHPFAGSYQLTNTDKETKFKYVLPAAANHNAKTVPAFRPPLQLQWRNEKNQLETRVEHAVRLKTTKLGWDVKVTTLIKVKAIFSVINVVDLRLPLPRTRGIFLFGSVAPASSFPAVVPWASLWNPYGIPWIDPAPEEFPITDNLDTHLKLIAQDAFGKTRVLLERGPKEITLKLQNTYQLPAPIRRIHLDLPRPINTQDGVAKIALYADERTELLYGPLGAEEPVPEKHRFEWTTEPSPTKVDFAWRPYQREVAAHSLVDVTLHQHTAEVRQTLSFPPDHAAPGGTDAKPFRVRLHLPRGVEKVAILSGGEITNQDADKQALWIKPTASAAAEKIEIVLAYDVALTQKKAPEDAVSGLHVPFFWPVHVSRKDAKVRIWSQTGGVKISLADELRRRGAWKERSVESVPGKDSFPLLVLQGVGVRLDLALKIEDALATRLAAFLADRGLIQVIMNDDGSQQCRARFLLRKINAGHVDVELPRPLAFFRERPVFMLGKAHLRDWKAIDAEEKTIRLKLNPALASLPALLEISYTIPPDPVERNSSWRTTLLVPQFQSPVVLGHLRWQLSLPVPMIATAFSRQVRADTQWGLQGWLLTPEPSVTSADLENWLTAKDGAAAAPAPAAVSFAFSGALLQPYVIYHWSRQWWLLGCSSLLLIVALAIYFSPLPRWAFWAMLLAGAVGVLILGILFPATLPPVLFGLQPGVVLLVLFIGIHWCWQERYRRQLVFLPAFSRTKPSTMTRSGSSKRPREASTVDAPAPAAAEGGSAPSPSGT